MFPKKVNIAFSLLPYRMNCNSVFTFPTENDFLMAEASLCLIPMVLTL